MSNAAHVNISLFLAPIEEQNHSKNFDQSSPYIRDDLQTDLFIIPFLPQQITNWKSNLYEIFPLPSLHTSLQTEENLQL